MGSAMIPSTKGPPPAHASSTYCAALQMGTVFDEHGKVPIADGAIHDYGLLRLGHTSVTVARDMDCAMPPPKQTQAQAQARTQEPQGPLPWPSSSAAPRSRYGAGSSGAHQETAGDDDGSRRARLSCWQLPPSPPSAPPPPPCSLPSLWLPQAPGHTTQHQDPGPRTQPSDAGCRNSGGHASRHTWQAGRLDWPRGHRREPISEAWLGASAYLAPADWN